MHSGFISFEKIPEIGFAHHFYTDSYGYSYKYNKKSFEIVYVKSGDIEVEFSNEVFCVPEGSVFVLFRHLPLKLRAAAGGVQAHCTVQVSFDYDFVLMSDAELPPEKKGFLLPFVTPPSKETERIKNELYSIVSDITADRDENSFSCGIRMLNIMRELDAAARKKLAPRGSSVGICRKVKEYIADNIDKKILLSDVAGFIEKSPNYINSLFKRATGLSVNQYICSERVKKIAELVKDCNLSFETACENVGITDISYGYRLFKKHMGTTPSKYVQAEIIQK